MLGLHPGVEFELDAATALIGLRAVHVRRLLEDLLDVHLLHESVPGRYRFHDLTRAHAAGAAEEEAEADRRGAVGRLLEYYCRETATAIVAAYPCERENRPAVAAAAREDPPP